MMYFKWPEPRESVGASEVPPHQKWEGQYKEGLLVIPNKA